MKYSTLALILLAFAVGCTDTSPTQENQEVPKSMIVDDFEIMTSNTEAPTMNSHGNFADSKNALEYPAEGVVVYTFNEFDRFTNHTDLDNPYHGLRFQSRPYFYVVGHTRGYVGGNLLIPINDDFSLLRNERVIELPNPVKRVEITTIWYRGSERPQLLAYDEQGEVITADTVKKPQRYLDYLSVASTDPLIHSIGLLGYDSGIYYDNLTLEMPTNQPPMAKFELPEEIEATHGNGVLVNVDGSLSSDPDGDELAYSWFLDEDSILSDRQGSITIPLGSHSVRLEVSDPSGAKASAAHTARVVDTTAPDIEESETVTELWPPNNKMRKVVVYEASDAVSTPELSIDVTSDTHNFSARDWRIDRISDTEVAVWVRATRKGKNRAGRIYYINTTATDEAGNTAKASLKVTVPHNKGR